MDGCDRGRPLLAVASIRSLRCASLGSSARALRSAAIDRCPSVGLRYGEDGRRAASPRRGAAAVSIYLSLKSLGSLEFLRRVLCFAVVLSLGVVPGMTGSLAGEGGVRLMLGSGALSVVKMMLD